MMKLNISFHDGVFKIKAVGGVMASLWWGNENGALNDWTAIAYVPLSPTGEGVFRYLGQRAVPPEADRVIARIIGNDGKSLSEISEPIPDEFRIPSFKGDVRFYLASDLHLNKKRGYLISSLKYSDGCDAILLSGDLINDGTSEQLKSFYDLLAPYLKKTPVFAVAGNHDFPICPENITADSFGWYDFQSRVLDSVEALGIKTERSESGAYSVQLKDIEVIGLNCVTDYRKFRFPDGQIEWLENHLNMNTRLKCHIILCHAPLIGHNPQRKPDRQPYLNKDIKLQNILNRHENIVFVSGHTHFSPNDYNGCVDFDRERNILYINDGSVCPTTSKWQETLVPSEWCSGIVSILSVSDGGVEIASISLRTGKKISRGYYRFYKQQPQND